jgi:hypothetical protein
MLARSMADPERAGAQAGAQALLAAALSAAVLLTPLAGAGPALAAGADVAAQAIQEYTQLEEKGKLKDLKSLETFRNSYGFKRNINGRVSVKGTSGQWYEVRLDMEVPGAIILQVGWLVPGWLGRLGTRWMAGGLLLAQSGPQGRAAASRAAQRAAGCCGALRPPGWPASMPAHGHAGVRSSQATTCCCCALLELRGRLASALLLLLCRRRRRRRSSSSCCRRCCLRYHRQARSPSAPSLPSHPGPHNPPTLRAQDANGFVYALETDGLQQVDLSDDVVVMLMFADGDWEGGLSPVEVEGEDGKAAQLQMSQREFREFVGLLKGTEAREG